MPRYNLRNATPETDTNVTIPPHVAQSEVPQKLPKPQRKTKNLGRNTSMTRDQSYSEIEKRCATAKCTDGKHEGNRVLPVREFYLNGGGNSLQGACIGCQKNRRRERILRSRKTFGDKTPQEVAEMYKDKHGPTKVCSGCNIAKLPSDFPVSISMDAGLHNHCKICTAGSSQGNGGLRDFIYMPDKDGIKYTKKRYCERCQGTNKLAVDHILPIAKGGSDCIVNKQTLCVHCNSKKSDTIDCKVTSEMLSERYVGSDLDFTNNASLSLILAKRVIEFRMSVIDVRTLDQIRISIGDYIKKNNLGHKLDRLVDKIAVLFNKV